MRAAGDQQWLRPCTKHQTDIHSMPVGCERFAFFVLNLSGLVLTDIRQARKASEKNKRESMAS